MECPECGATYTSDSDFCAERFNVLLALDHSRPEPWGSRHGQAFAAFVLQHPERFKRSVDRAWATLQQIYVVGEEPERVVAALLSSPYALPAWWTVAPRSVQRHSAPSMTIADLGDFSATSYAERLDAWCLASLAAWSPP